MPFLPLKFEYAGNPNMVRIARTNVSNGNEGNKTLHVYWNWLPFYSQFIGLLV